MNDDAPDWADKPDWATEAPTPVERPAENEARRTGIKPVAQLRGVNDMPSEGTHFKPGYEKGSLAKAPGAVAGALGGMLEAPLAMGSGAVATGVSAPAGLVAGIRGGMDAAADTMRTIQEAGTYQPRTQQGKMATNMLGAPFAMAGEAGAAGVKALGGGENKQQLARDVTPAVASTVLGLKGAVKPGAMKLPQHIDAMKTAQESGYMMPPKDVNPSAINKAASTVARPSGVENSLAAKNVAVTERLAKADLGLAATDYLNEDSLAGVRKSASKPYEDIKSSGKVFDTTDHQFVQDLKDVDKELHQAKAEFPEAFRDQPLENIRSQVSNAKGSGDSIIKLIQKYRKDATTLLKKSDMTPGDVAAASARKHVATVLEDLLDRELNKDPKTAGLVPELRKSRELIAKTHDVEAAANLKTGDIDPAKLAKLEDNGVKLTGNLAKIAQAYRANAKVVKSRASLSSDSVHAGDSAIGHALLAGGGAALGTLAGHPVGGAALGVAVPSAVRGVVASRPYQRVMAKPRPMQIAPSTVDPRAAALGATATALPPAMKPPMEDQQ